jgi:hypothetical protein
LVFRSYPQLIRKLFNAYRLGSLTRLRLRGSHALRRAFPDPSPHSVPDYGCPATPPGPEPWRFGLCPVRSPLLGVSLLFSLPAGTGMFRFPAFAPANWWPVSLLMGCPIRTPADQRLLAPPRGVSPLAASFLASWSLGIHRPPLLSFPFSARHCCQAAFSYLFLYSLQNVNGLFLPPCGRIRPADSSAADRRFFYDWRDSLLPRGE